MTSDLIKQLKVVNVNTERNSMSNIGWNNFDADVKNGYKYKPNKRWMGKFRHIYFISDDKAENGEWGYCENNKWSFGSGGNRYEIMKCSDNIEGKKIFATTNHSLNVPKIPESFEQFFVKSRGTVDKVEIEYKDSSFKEFNILRVKKWSAGIETDWLPYTKYRDVNESGKKTTSEKVCNNNVLIAHFMGLKRGNDWEIRSEKADWCHPMDLKYDTSWDWLMPVIEKIDLNYANVRVSAKICAITRKFISNKQYAKEHNIPSDEVPPIGECNTETFILNVWVSVVQFLNWYYEKNNIEKPKPIEFYEG